MHGVNKINIEKGFYLFKLRNILENRSISINRLMKDTNTDFKVIKRLMTGELVKIDIFVLARICDYLNCSMEEIFEYKQNQKKE